VIGHTVILKVVAFAVITLLGVSYTAVRYLGVGAGLFTPQYDVALDLSDSGGIFPSAQVTYRGIGVGRVGAIALRDDGIRVTLQLETHEKIPAQLQAVVANGSAVGEQYVDLQPTTTEGPYLEAGSVIPESATALPISTTTLLTALDDLVNSVPRDDLRTVVHEAGVAFGGKGRDLQRLLDSSSALVAEAQAALPETQRLLVDAETVLATQREQGSAITAFSRDLSDLSDQLKRSDGDLRTILRDGVPAARELDGLVGDLEPSLGPLLRDFADTNEVLGQRVNNLRQILIMYPYLVSASLVAFPGDNTARFAVPVNQAGVPACREGYMPLSEWRSANDVDPLVRPFPFDSYCKAPSDSGVAVRGARNAPKGGATR
jgi:phospholipid/cholesterol/gamma-HCH transport system substrate-binding protein